MALRDDNRTDREARDANRDPITGEPGSHLGLDDREHVRMGVEIQGPVSRLPDDRLDELGSTVQAAAGALEGLPISMAFGDF